VAAEEAIDVIVSRDGQVTLKSNCDEALSDESLYKLTAMKRLTMIFFKNNADEALNAVKKS
jgi:hypothetical protein